MLIINSGLVTIANALKYPFQLPGKSEHLVSWYKKVSSPTTPTNTSNLNRPIEIKIISMRGDSEDPVVASLIAALQDENSAVRGSAALALGRIGTPALAAEPFLIEILNAERDGEPSYQDKFSAVTALGWLGPDVKDALPDLVKFFGYHALYSDYASHVTAIAIEQIAGAKGLLELLMASLENESDDETESYIAQILRLMGPSAREIVPDVALMLQDENSFYTAVNILEGIGSDASEAVPALIELLDDPEKRKQAIPVLTLIGPEAQAAVPALLDLLQDPDLYEVDDALIAIQPEAETVLPILIELLDDPEIGERAINVMASMGPDAQVAIPSLLEVIKTSEQVDLQRTALLAISAIGYTDGEVNTAVVNSLQNPELHSAGAIALGKLQSNPLLAVTALSSNLHEDGDFYREEKIRVLGEMGAAAQASVPALVGVLKYECLKYEETDTNPGSWIQENHELCASTVATLANIGSAAVPDLVNLLKSESREDRSLAAITLSQLGADAQAAIPALVIALEDQDEYVRKFAAAALGEIGNEALPPLLDTLQSQTPTTRDLAAAAMGDMGTAAVPGLVELINVDDPETRLPTMMALAQIGPDALPALPALVKALEDKDPDIRNQAAITLGRMGPQAHSAISALAKALNDSQPTVRSSAAAALESIGAEARVAIPALVEALADSDPQVRSSAAAAIGTLDPGTEVNPVLIAALKDADPLVRQRAATALGEINSQTKLEPSTLIQAFESDDWVVQRHAVENLIRMGSKALPYLQDALSSDNPLVRRNAAYAVLRLAPESEILRPELLRALGDQDIVVFAFSLFALDNLSIDVEGIDVEGNNLQLAFAVAEAYLNFFGSASNALWQGGVDRPTVCIILYEIDDGAASRLHLSCQTAGRAWQWVGAIFKR
jgi:HEAT repeat protein